MRESKDMKRFRAWFGRDGDNVRASGKATYRDRLSIYARTAIFGLEAMLHHDNDKEVWNELYDSFFHKTRRKKIDQMIPRGSGIAVDLGCGPGPFTRLLEMKNYSVVAIDLRHSRLKINESVYKIVCDLNTYVPLRASCCDLVMATEIIEHLKDGSSFLLEIYRILKTGGKLVMSTPNNECLIKYFETLRGKGWKGWGRDHFHIFTIKELRDLLVQSGFRICKESGFYLFYYLPISFPKSLTLQILFMCMK